MAALVVDGLCLQLSVLSLSGGSLLQTAEPENDKSFMKLDGYTIIRTWNVMKELVG